MVKGRKVQSGSSNLNIQEGDQTIKAPTKFFRAPTHKLIAPDVYTLPTSTTHVRSIESMATWGTSAVHNRDYQTTHTSTFKDPSTYPEHERKGVCLSSIEVQKDHEREAAFIKAMHKLCTLSKNTYGTTSALLKSFKKKQGDQISAYELGEYIKRLKKGQEEMTDDEIHLIFEKVDPKHIGKVEVTDFLKKVEENELEESTQSRELRLMKEYLETHVAKKKDHISSTTIPEVEKIKLMRSVENENNLIHAAVGAKHLSTADEVTYHDFEEVLGDLFDDHHTHHISSENNRFARYLRYANVKLANVPFYSMRKKEMDASKQNAVLLHNQLDNPEVLGRLKELEKTRWRSSLSTINSYYDSEDPRHSRTLERSKSRGTGDFSNGEVRTGAMALSQSLPNLSLSSPMTEAKEREQPTALTHVKKGKNSKPKNFVLDSQKGLSIDDNSSVNSAAVDGLETSSTKSSSPEKRALKSLRQKTLLFQRPEEFSIPITLPSASNTRPNTGGESNLSRSSSQLKVLEELSDNSRQQGGTHYQMNSEDRRFLTTNAKFYPQILYEPSKPPRREILSEAEADSKQREYRRQQRFARKEANLDVTRVRLEYDEVNSRVKELNRMTSKNEDKLRYQTHILLDDLRSFKQMPLERIGRRPNLLLSDKIFGGQLDKQTTGVVPENRDFFTTYSSSFTKDVFNKET